MNLPNFTRLPIFLTMLAATNALAATTDWPQFRGPSGDGHATGTGLPVSFGEEEKVKWKTAIHGRGWSSPVIAGEQVWLTTATEDGTQLSVMCVNKTTGKVEQDKVLFRVEKPQFCHKFNSYASPTPAIDGGRVYVTFGSPGTACVDAKTGDVVWERKDFVCNHYRGAGSSPIVWGKLLIMNFDGSDAQFVVALDTATGKTVWETKRSVDYNDLDKEGKPSGEGDYRKAFSTPQVIEQDGKPVLVSSGAKAHYGYDPATGKELWRFGDPEHHSAATRPVAGFGMVFIPAGFSQGEVLAIKPGSGVLTEEALEWRLKKSAPNKPSLLLVDDLLYAINDGGIATCMEAKTGTVVWSQRVQGNYSAAPIYADGRIYVCSEEGKVAVLATGREFKLLAENKLANGVMSSPAVSGKALFVRTKTDLYRIEE